MKRGKRRNKKKEKVNKLDERCGRGKGERRREIGKKERNVASVTPLGGGGGRKNGKNSLSPLPSVFPDLFILSAEQPAPTQPFPQKKQRKKKIFLPPAAASKNTCTSISTRRRRRRRRRQDRSRKMTMKKRRNNRKPETLHPHSLSPPP